MPFWATSYILGYLVLSTIRWLGDLGKQESPTSLDAFIFCCFCTMDCRTPAIRLGYRSPLLPIVFLTGERWAGPGSLEFAPKTCKTSVFFSDFWRYLSCNFKCFRSLPFILWVQNIWPVQLQHAASYNHSGQVNGQPFVLNVS